MSKKGVAKISGNSSPKVGEKTAYAITDWYPSTPVNERNPALVTWELFKKRSDGSYTSTNIKKKGDGNFTFGEVAAKNTYRLEAYLHEPEGQGSTTIDITPQPAGVPQINKVELRYVDDSPGTVFSYNEKLVAKAQCVNLTGKKLLFTLWEDDAGGDGHNANNSFIDSKEVIVDRTGTGTAEFVLSKALMQKAAQGETEPRKLEFYVTVEYYKDRKHATKNVDVQNPEYKEPAQQPNRNSNPQQNNNSPAKDDNQQPTSKKEENGVGDNAQKPDAVSETKGTVEPEQKPAVQKPEGKTTSVVEEPKTESLLDAFFAKEEFTKETDETDGTHTYTFGKDNNNINKDNIAKIIKGKVDSTAKKDKKYAKLDGIKTTLSKTSYKKGETISFPLYKLGPVMVRVNNAPLEEEVFVVAKTMLLDGKEVSINIREKEELLVAKDANLPVLEAKENGAELTTLKATAQNGLAKVKIKLRPKSDDTLKEWREKLSGKKDGTHTYKFGGTNKTATAEEKKKIAGVIANKIKDELAKNEKFPKADIIEKVLTKEVYNKDEEVTFDVFKKVTEFLWLKAECTGDIKKHEGEFLKKEGAYFEIAKKCPRCEAEITVDEFKLMYPNVTQLFSRGTNSFGSPTIETFLKSLNKTLKEFKINTCVKKAFFLTQITKETGEFARADENLTYTTEGALHNFWTKASHPRLYSNPSEFFNNPEKLGNYVYRDIAENGSEASGDGYKYRGRGLIQITRKKGFRRFGEYAGKDLVGSPDLLLSDLDLTTRSAGWYWKHGVLLNDGSEKDLNTVAEKGDFKEVTRLVHGSTNDVAARETILNKIKEVLKTDECQATNTGDSDVEYHIQSTGEIQYKFKNDKRESAAYFYHDSAGNIHDLGKYKLVKVKENYGGVYKDKLGKDTENIYLIDIRNVKHSYKKGTIGFTMTVNTSRYYMNDVTMAGLFGALLECNYDDFVFNGFSNEKGESVGGSKSHKNGMNGDLRYLRTDKKGGKTDLFNDGEETGWKGLDETRQNTFNDALYKFGWKSMLSQNYGDKSDKILNHCTHDKDKNHNDHLHIQGFAPTLKEI
ncbi:putative chitinase [Chryseobacterium ginsenosidimutans]|uniref:glycoside hydrolase family 19 protein n=1 Tax=Chryseobacterium ginsenosidimutans TaxID=687846 RepID=UPI00277DD36B|nr:glycoside hydrolase family 19 protein [Chryseobacterium ginsenosidimutans]MDQ0595311.1 putative chitinase [Chryseobacterium ginsenosidimutans]